jgi:hypothetical protein
MKATIPDNMTTSSAEHLNIKIDIQGIHESVIYEYFVRLNNGEFTATAELFGKQGCLNPPFDNQIQGIDAIALYLGKEAKGIKFMPERGKIVTNVDAEYNLEHGDRTQYQIRGKVEVNWFTVNIIWLIQINAAKEIILVEVKLLTSLEDLLSFNRI